MFLACVVYEADQSSKGYSDIAGETIWRIKTTIVVLC